MDDEEIRI